MSKLYESLRMIDIVSPIAKAMIAGKFKICRDRIQYEYAQTPDTMWLPVKVAEDRDCWRWNQIYFNFYRFIPKKCFGCWKIVVRFDKLDELMAIEELQRRLEIPGKCGVETRNWIKTKRRYAAFWYAPLEGGLEKAKELRREIEIEVHKIVSIMTPVAIKRGCSEFERAFGPSERWQYPKTWELKEQLLDAVLEERDIIPRTISSFLANFIRSKWIEFAWESNDPTVWNWAEKDSFPEDTTFYHDRQVLLASEEVKGNA